MTPLLEVITDREEEVLRLLARGHGTREIGALLGIAESTVLSHRENLRRKLDARNQTHAVTIYLERLTGVVV